MKLRNRIIASIVSLTSIVSMTSLVASAANTSNTYWLAGYDYCRYKSDDSSVYVKNSSMSYKVKVSVYGEYSATGNARYPIGSNPIIVNQNDEVYIPQYCYEWGYSYLHIVFEPVDGNYASGVWSPDSI